METELAPTQSLAQTPQRRLPRHLSLLVPGIEQVVAVLARLLGGVHGVIGVPNQRVGVALVSREHRDADAGRNAATRLAVQIIGLPDSDKQAVDRGDTFVVVDQVAEQDNKFIAAQARHGVAAAHTGAQPARHFDQHPVAGRMAQAVVDFLEAIQIQVADGNVQTTAPATPNRLRQTVGDQQAVGQTGQRIVAGNTFQVGGPPGLDRNVVDVGHHILLAAGLEDPARDQYGHL